VDVEGVRARIEEDVMVFRKSLMHKSTIDETSLPKTRILSNYLE